MLDDVYSLGCRFAASFFKPHRLHHLFLSKQKKSQFVGFHAFQSLLTQMPVSILNAGAVTWLAVILLSQFREWENFVIYTIFTGIMNLVYLIFSIVDAVKARRGEFYYFIFFGKIAFDRFYGAGAEKHREKVRQNLPPKGY
ncbi:DUF4870 domain-containing protein [Acidobacteriota bacterium]